MDAKFLVLSSWVAAIGLCAVPVVPGVAATSAADVVKSLDTDGDGTLDLAEIQKAAAVRFDALDPDHDGTIDKKEAAKAHITAAEFGKPIRTRTRRSTRPNTWPWCKAASRPPTPTTTAR